MSAIYINGDPIVQSSFPEMTLAQYNALPEAEKPEYWIRTDASYDSIPADAITFDNTGTDLVSENVEDAIKEAYGKSAKSADLTSISESGTTASQAISAGTYFYLNGTLVRAKTAIASGATFTLNTNYELVTRGGLNAVKVYYKDITKTSSQYGVVDIGDSEIDNGILISAVSAGGSPIVGPLRMTNTNRFYTASIQIPNVTIVANTSTTIRCAYLK